MPEKAQLKGRLTLHSVEIGPTPAVQALVGLLGVKVPSAVRLAKDDVVTFSMHDGRVHHEGLAFGLADVEPEMLIRSHGSVGLDQTLDWFVQLPALGGRLPEGPLREALSQAPITLHITGTLERPMVKLPLQGGQLAPAVKALTDALKRRAESRAADPQQRLLPGRRGEKRR
jgi:hypothetical protein